MISKIHLFLFLSFLIYHDPANIYLGNLHCAVRSYIPLNRFGKRERKNRDLKACCVDDVGRL